MTSAELDDGAVEREPAAASGSDGAAVQVTGGVFAWDDEVEAGQEVLRGVDLDIRTGALAAVVGMVGSGKSSLLGCILGEMRKVSGKVRAHSHPIAGSYCMHLSHHYVVLTHN
jgi:ATP-binding cassette subfamily C (CFTR/MRP) protein 1